MIHETELYAHTGSAYGGRDRLIAALLAVATESQVREIVDALDAYLAEDGPGREVMNFEDLTPNYKDELNRMRVERDMAIQAAQQVLQQMQATLNALRMKPTNGHTKELEHD